MSTIPVAPPALAYHRIKQNHRKTIWLVVVAILLTIPFVLGMSFAVAEGVTWQASRQSRLDRFHELRMLHRMASNGDDLRADLRAASAYDPGEKKMRLEIMLVCAAALAAVLGLLVWGFGSSPTSKLLAMCGARPAGNEERGAQGTLERLAAAADLPTPRLYVIESMSLNAFAAGSTPETAVIAVTHGLAALLDERELEGVLAHELSHIGNRDTRLNIWIMSFALFLRMPYLMRRRGMRIRLGRSILMLPVSLYVFLVAPVMAAIVRSAISRSREFLADADAALLTGHPEGLMRALAKIAGAGSCLPGSNPAVAHLYFADPAAPGAETSRFTGSLLATHPPIEERIAQLVECGGPASAALIESARDAGRKFTENHPALPQMIDAPEAAAEELALVTSGNPMGRVFRVLSDGTPIFDRDNPSSMVIARAAKYDLLVVFDDPGKMRQVVTRNQTFGYIPYSVKLQLEDMMPAEIHTSNARAPVPEPAGAAPAAAAEPDPESAGPETAPRTRFAGLTPQQIAFCAGFGIVVFAGMLILLVSFGGK